MSINTTFDESAYDTIMQVQPNLLVVIGQLLDKGQTPKQIARAIEARGDAFLAAMAEMAAAHMASTGVRPSAQER